MKGIRVAAMVGLISIASLMQAQSDTTTKGHVSDRDRLIGAWHLVRIESPGPDGKTLPAPRPKGMLIYTRDGHMSVQLMYPMTPAVPSNEYVLDGYEASFGSFDIDETTHMLTHHVQASVTRDLLVGKDLSRAYQFTPEGYLVIRSGRPEEHWSVTWEHDEHRYIRRPRAMKSWTTEELQKIANADDLHISPLREDGKTYGTPTWIWSVVVDDGLYVRGYNGQNSTWYQAALKQKSGRIRVAGSAHEVAFEPVTGDLNYRIDDAYRKKYRTSSYLPPMIEARARAATVKIIPKT